MFTEYRPGLKKNCIKFNDVIRMNQVDKTEEKTSINKIYLKYSRTQF